MALPFRSFLTLAFVAAWGTQAQTVNESFRATVNGPATAQAVLAHSSGKTYAATGATKVDGLPATSRFIRLNADGSWDQGYTLGQTLNGAVTEIIELEDHRIALLGTFTSAGGITTDQVAILTSDGAIDSSFASPIGTISGTPRFLCRNADGTFFVCCTGQETQQSPREEPSFRGAVVKLLANGQRDPGFTPPNASLAYPYSGSAPWDEAGATFLVPLFDNNLLVAGTFLEISGHPATYVAKLSPAGEVVFTFSSPLIKGDSWKFLTTEPLGVQAGAVRPDGSIVLGGAFFTNEDETQASLARLTSAGALDPTFRVQLDSEWIPGSVAHVASFPSGSLAILGSFHELNGDYSVNDAAILDGAGVPVKIWPQISSSKDVSIRPDGASIFARNGWSNRGGIIAPSLISYSPDGTEDASFRVDMLARGRVDSLIALPDEKGVLVYGLYVKEINDSPFSGAALLDPEGVLDPAFALAVSPANGVKKVLPLPGGDYLLAGTIASVQGRPTTNLAIVDSRGGVVRTFSAQEGPSGQVYDAHLMPDGGVLISGGFSKVGGHETEFFAILDFRPGRDLVDSRFRFRLKGSFPTQIAFQEDGRIVAGGWFSAAGSSPNRHLVRINLDGSLDESFRPLDVFGDETFTWIEALAIDPQGRIIAGGNFGSGLDAPKELQRFFQDGSLDSSFEPPDGLWSVSSIIVQSDSSLLVEGSFFSSSGISGDVGRLLESGTVDPSFTLESSDISGMEVAPPLTLWIWGTSPRINDVDRSAITKLRLPAPIAPIVTVSPSRYSAYPGERVALTVITKGSGETFQWFKNGEQLSRQTGRRLILGSVSDEDAARYTVRVSNVAGSTFTHALVTADAIRPGSRPKLTVDLPKRIRQTRRVLKVAAKDLGYPGSATLEFKLGRGKFRKASASGPLALRLRLKPGKNILSLRAVMPTGERSRIRRLVIIVQ